MKDPIEQLAKTHVDQYIVTDLILKAKDKRIADLELEIANVKEGMKYAAKVAAEMRIGAESALNVARFFKGKWEKAERKLSGDFSG